MVSKMTVPASSAATAPWVGATGRLTAEARDFADWLAGEPGKGRKQATALLELDTASFDLPYLRSAFARWQAEVDA